MLLRLGNFDAKGANYNGHRALYLVTGNRHCCLVEFLCMKGVDINVADWWG